MTMPAITIVSPPADQVISSSVPIIFDVTDPDTFRRIVVTAIYGGSIIEEVVHDGLGFAAAYTGGSNARAAIANGYRYTVLRLGGWRGSSVTLKILAIDAFGNLGVSVVGSDPTFVWHTISSRAIAPFIG